MPFDMMMTMPRPRPRRIGLALSCGLLAGCAGEGVKGVAEATGLATTTQEPKAFVVETRPPGRDYIPVGTNATREQRRKTVSEFKTLEGELEAKRLSNEAAGGQAQRLGATPPPKPAVIRN